MVVSGRALSSPSFRTSRVAHQRIELLPKPIQDELCCHVVYTIFILSAVFPNSIVVMIVVQLCSFSIVTGDDDDVHFTKFSTLSLYSRCLSRLNLFPHDTKLLRVPKGLRQLSHVSHVQ